MFRLRPATHTDEDILRVIHHTAFHDVVEATWGWDETMQNQMWADYVVAADLQVIEVDGNIAGYLDVQTTATDVFVANIALDPTIQSKGIGSAILMSLIQDAQRNHLPLRLEVIKANERARTLYERLGFAMTGETSTHFTMEYLRPA